MNYMRIVIQSETECSEESQLNFLNHLIQT